jgi:hypothetical protein
MISQPTDRCSPLRHCCPLAFIKQSRDAKIMVRKHHTLTILLFHPPFFNKTPIFRVNLRSRALQPTEQFLPLCNCRLLEYIKTEQGGKKKGEKQSRVFNFSVL